MGDTVAGISLPPGNPGAIEDAAQGLKRVASGFSQAGDTARAAASSVSWTGTASEAFGARTGDYEDASRRADTAAMQAAGVLTRFAQRLEEGIDRVRRLQDRALEAEERMQNATREAIAAGVRESAARTRAAAITVTDLLDITGSTALADQSAALQEADTAAADRVRYEGIADRARDELEQLREEAREEREAVKDAATSAAGELNGAQNGLPVLYHGGMYGTAGGMEDRVLTGVRNGDYSVLEGLELDTLDEDTQQAVGAEIAKDADQAAYKEGDHSLAEVSSVVTRFGADEDFAVGFYNRLGGRGTADLASNIVYFHGDGAELDDPAMLALMAPFANMLGTATRSELRRGFTNGFLRRDLSVRDRFGGLTEIEAFVMAGESSNYDSRFLSEVGEEILITPIANPDDQLGMSHHLSEHQELMDFVAENPEAAGLLLAGRHGPDNYFSNVGPLLLAGREYTDDGAALGNLIQAGTHDLRGTNMALSNEASHMVIQGTPQFGDQLPDGAKPALVTILDDHMDDFEYVATERSVSNVMERPADGISGLTYEQGHDYLKLLMGDDGMRSDASTLIGERTAENMYQSAAREDTSYANRAGALSEIGVMALGDAELDDAKAKDAANQMAQTASSKIAALTPLKRVPGLTDIADVAFKDLFPTDAVKSMEDQQLRQTDQLQSVKRLSIAMQVEVGDLPREAMSTINLDGSVNVDFVSGPNGDDDVIMVDTDGDNRPDKPLEWDFNEDGDTNDEGERRITERQLYDAGLGQGEAAMDGSINLREERFNANHEPDIDDLPLPDGYDQNDPSTFERVWEWPFDAEGEFTNGDGEVVARQEDISWDPVEKVFRVPIEGTSDELTYQRVGEDLVRVVKRDGTWVEAP